MDLARLQRWLVGAFTAAELRRVVRLGPEGERVAASLPTAGTLDELAFEVTMAWDRHGVPSMALRDLLLSERPLRRSELVELWASEPPPDEAVREDDFDVDFSSILDEPQTHQLKAHLRQLTEETAPGVNAIIKVTKLTELIGGVLVRVEVTMRGDFADEKVAMAHVQKFLTSPWAAPISNTTFDHDDERLIFPAHAIVSTRHFYSVDQAANANSGSEK